MDRCISHDFRDGLKCSRCGITARDFAIGARKAQMKIIYVWGTTCVGKSTMLEAASKYTTEVGLCEVGKEFRKRYPPEHFAGQGAPAHTQNEALQILHDFYTRAKEERRRFLLVDGQPRDLDQVKKVTTMFQEHEQEIWWLWIDKKETEERIHRRFPNDEASRKLSFDRILNDRIQLFDVAWEILHREIPVHTIYHGAGFNYPSFFQARLK